MLHHFIHILMLQPAKSIYIGNMLPCTRSDSSHRVQRMKLVVLVLSMWINELREVLHVPGLQVSDTGANVVSESAIEAEVVPGCTTWVFLNESASLSRHKGWRRCKVPSALQSSGNCRVVI